MVSGPNIARFREAHALKSIGALQVAPSIEELSVLIKDLLTTQNSSQIKNSGRSAKSWLLEQRGASEKITSYLP
jgi:hypothetical protein